MHGYRKNKRYYWATLYMPINNLTFNRRRNKLEKKWKRVPSQDKDFEGGFGGQEDLEDRYATTSGDH